MLQSPGDFFRAVFVAPDQDEQEFVAANANHGLVGAHVAHQEARHALQNIVAPLVTELVVELLEAIDVDENAAPRA